MSVSVYSSGDNHPPPCWASRGFHRSSLQVVAMQSHLNKQSSPSVWTAGDLPCSRGRPKPRSSCSVCATADTAQVYVHWFSLTSVHLLFLEPSRMAPGSSQSHVQPFILLSWLPVSQTLSLFISSRFALLHKSAVLSARLSAYSSSDRLFTWKQFKSKFTGKNLIRAPCPMAWWLNEKSFVQLWARTLWAVSDAVFVISCFPQMRSKRQTKPFSPLLPWLKQISRDSDMSAVSNST